MAADAIARTIDVDHHTVAGAYTVTKDATSATHRVTRIARSHEYRPRAQAANGSHQLSANPWVRGSSSGRLNGE